MAYLVVDDMQRGYVQVCRMVRDKGEPIAPHGQPTRELLNTTVEVKNIDCCLPIDVGRQCNTSIGAVEAAQLVGGCSAPELVVRISPAMRQYTDSGQFHGAYGPRIRRQVAYVIECLQDDPDSRQAVITIWDPIMDAVTTQVARRAAIPIPRDLPCTITLQFTIRDGRLNMHTTMRSNDVWLGLAYDCFQFTQLQWTVARVLGLHVGRYYHHAVSLHLYERDAAKVNALVYPLVPMPLGFVKGFGRSGMTWDECRDRAAAIVSGEVPEDQTRSEAWYHERLHGS